ncbi:MAG: lectin-like protein [Polyangiaceae bacterium]
MGGRNALRLALACGLLGGAVCCTLERTGTGDIDLVAAGGATDAGEDVLEPDASFGGTLTGGEGGEGGTGATGSGGAGGTGSAECGNGIREAEEQCDDNNTTPGDGCSDECQVECPANSSVGPNYHCYWFIRDSKNWGDARNDCVAQGGYLVTLTSDSENSFLAALTVETTWLGATDGRQAKEKGAGNYAWVSGESFGYQHWAQGEPNAGDKGCGFFETCYEHCATMRDDGTWNDSYCEDDKYPYVCEKIPPGIN